MPRFDRILFAVVLLAAGTCNAGDMGVPNVLEDTKLYFTAPLRWDREDWAYFGGALLTVAIAHEYDDDVRTHFADGSHAAAPGKDPNSTKHALPAAVLLGGTVAAALLTQDHDGYTESWSMVEAGALSGVSSLALKYAFGRERPNDTARTDAWFESGDSFPSMHTTLAFAIGTVLAESGNDNYRWVRRALGYGVAGGTAYLRLRDNVHWLSDTVAGAALGMASAHFVMNRRTHRDRRVSFSVTPTGDGVVLGFVAPLD